MSDYDSAFETASHIGLVAEYLSVMVSDLVRRAGAHDQSKFSAAEKPAFDAITPRLKGVTYGSEEYRSTLREFRPAIDHHHKANRHHPECHATGIVGMTLVDLVEMLADWTAASRRHADGDIVKSIEINAERFSIQPQLKQILLNTVEQYFETPASTPAPGAGR
jgi:hypothetical protein